MIDDVACIVVHHNRVDELISTLSSIVDAGVPSTHTIVIDNSPATVDLDHLASVLLVGVRLVHTENRGYGAAVNYGLSCLAELGIGGRYVLVTSHEARLPPDCVAELYDAVRETGSAAAGPTLLLKSSPRVVWSLGGRLSKVLSMPRHITKADPGQLDAPIDRDWLDGAVVMYARTALEQGFREDFFLYFEEVELHQRLRAQGSRIVWAPRAIAYQESSGTPAYLIARNQLLFQKAAGSTLGRRFAALYSIFWESLRCAYHLRWPKLAPMVRGLVDGSSSVVHLPREPMTADALEHVLEELGHD